MDLPVIRYLSQLLTLTADPLYLVGGSIRDLLLGAAVLRDIDLLMPADSEGVARRFADKIGGSFFFLDKERGITRVVKQEEGGSLQFDFTDFRGPDLAADLARRDFSMNAMALDLRSFVRHGSLDGLVDPFGGREDIRQRTIRTIDPTVLDADPLRLLRAVRFAATLDYSLDRETAAAIAARAAWSAKPAPERIRDELFLVLAEKRAESHLRLMDSLGLLTVLIPELGPLRNFAPGKHHRYDIFTHSLRTAGHVDTVLEGLGTLTPRYGDTVLLHLQGSLEHGITRMAALRFACLLHDVAKAETCIEARNGDIRFYGHDQVGADAVKGVCARMRLSRETTATVERLVRNHMRLLSLSTSRALSKRALHRYCRDLKDTLPESIVLSLADARATAEAMPAEDFTDTERTAAAILEYYYERFSEVKERPLVTGKDLIDRGLQPGPLFREILEDIGERQADGTLQSREDALQYLDRKE